MQGCFGKMKLLLASLPTTLQMRGAILSRLHDGMAFFTVRCHRLESCSPSLGERNP